MFHDISFFLVSMYHSEITHGLIVNSICSQLKTLFFRLNHHFSKLHQGFPATRHYFPALRASSRLPSLTQCGSPGAGIKAWVKHWNPAPDIRYCMYVYILYYIYYIILYIVYIYILHILHIIYIFILYYILLYIIIYCSTLLFTVFPLYLSVVPSWFHIWKTHPLSLKKTCSTNIEYAMGCLNFCLLIYVDLCWFILIYVDLSWFMLIYVDLCWFMLIYVDLCWFILIYVDLCWFMLIYVDLCWFMLIYVDLSWFILIYLDLSWFMLIYVDLCWFMLPHPTIATITRNFKPDLI